MSLVPEFSWREKTATKFNREARQADFFANDKSQLAETFERPFFGTKQAGMGAVGSIQYQRDQKKQQAAEAQSAGKSEESDKKVSECCEAGDFRRNI